MLPLLIRKSAAVGVAWSSCHAVGNMLSNGPSKLGPATVSRSAEMTDWLRTDDFMPSRSCFVSFMNSENSSWVRCSSPSSTCVKSRRARRTNMPAVSCPPSCSTSRTMVAMSFSFTSTSLLICSRASFIICSTRSMSVASSILTVLTVFRCSISSCESLAFAVTFAAALSSKLVGVTWGAFMIRLVRKSHSTINNSPSTHGASP